MISFDQSIPTLCNTLKDALGKIPPETLIVRDVTGSLTLLLPQEQLAKIDRSNLASLLNRALGAYAPGEERVLFPIEEVLDPEALRRDANPWTDELGKCTVQLVDRLLTNQDWTKLPIRTSRNVPLGVAFSIKGGVGRSTAFAVLAIHLAKSGKRVAVVDLDLEAPGIAGMLTSGPAELGLTDWFVESLVGQASTELLDRVKTSWTADDSVEGTIDVFSAFGSSSKAYVSKLGRIYAPTLTTHGQEIGFADRLDELISRLEETEKYDAILLDSRAGLHDIGSAAVTRLGAKVFMFARDDAQTWDGYRHLFEHLQNSRAIRWAGKENDDDLRWRLRMVAAQLGAEERDKTQFIERSHNTWTSLYDQEDEAGDQIAFSFSQDDHDGPHYPTYVIFDPRAKGLNFASQEHAPNWEIVTASFGAFARFAEKWLLEK